MEEYRFDLFSKLQELQSLIKKESSLKKRSKLIYNIFLII